MISLKSCLTIFLVSSSQALTSSARIPLLCGDLPFVSLLIALCNSSVVISSILVSSLISCSKSSLSLSDVGNSFSRCYAFSFVVLYFCDENFLLCCFDHRDISNAFELFKDSLHFFFWCIFYAFAQILQSLFLFFGCASPLLGESQDFNIFVQELFILFCCCRCDHAHFFDGTCLFILMRNSYTKMFFWIVFKMLITVCVVSAVAPLPASRSRRCSHFLFHLHVHLLDLRFSQAGVGVDSAVAPLPSCPVHCLSFSSSLQRCVDVHPSWRLCSCWAGTPRWSVTVLLRIMLLLSISCATASASVLSASAAAIPCASASVWVFSCGVFSFDLIFHVTSCVMYFIFFFGGGFFIVSTISWYLSSSAVISILVFFSFCTCSTYRIVSCSLFSLLPWVFFPGVLMKKVAMIHLWSLPMWIMSLASASFTFLKNLLLVRMQSICFSFPFGETKDVCLCGVFLNIVLSSE